jgi:hypothetical protein
MRDPYSRAHCSANGDRGLTEVTIKGVPDDDKTTLYVYCIE